MLKRPVVGTGARRKPIHNARRDKRMFTRTAQKMHPTNAPTVSRGGIRL